MTNAPYIYDSLARHTPLDTYRPLTERRVARESYPVRGPTLFKRGFYYNLNLFREAI